MVRCEAVRVPRSRAEPMRRRLLELGLLRTDVALGRDGEDLLLPVSAPPAGLSTEVHDLEARQQRTERYQELLPPALRELAPRAFDQLGDIVIVKVPPGLWGDRRMLGEALLRFQARARAVFHDHGVKGECRVRELERIAGEGGSRTTVHENGITLDVDPATAYFSPRLGMERARIASLVRPGEHTIDLFGGVGSLAIQAAKAGARVDNVDLNPAACALARENVARNGVAADVTVHEGDARRVAERLGPADRLVMNLPHGAKRFLGLAPGLLAPGAVLHHHEILPRAGVGARIGALEAAFLPRAATVEHHRVVRTYSTEEDHVVFDIRLA